MENGLRYVMPGAFAISLAGISGAGDKKSLSDSASLTFDVMVIIGGTKGKSSDPAAVDDRIKENN